MSATIRSSTRSTHHTSTQAQTLRPCERGHHRLTATFRPGEHVCLECNVVFYCPACLKAHQLQRAPGSRVYPIECAIHQGQSQEGAK
jgi:hypothetical protein